MELFETLEAVMVTKEVVTGSSELASKAEDANTSMSEVVGVERLAGPPSGWRPYCACGTARTVEATKAEKSVKVCILNEEFKD